MLRNLRAWIAEITGSTRVYAPPARSALDDAQARLSAAYEAYWDAKSRQDTRDKHKSLSALRAAKHAALAIEVWG
jgi:hypothetical protein